jgi:hypothetical protein
VARKVEKINAYRVVVAKSVRMRSLGRPRRRRENNIKMYLEGIRWKSMDWLQSSSDQRQVASCCEHGNKTSSFIKQGNFENLLASEGSATCS